MSDRAHERHAVRLVVEYEDASDLVGDYTINLSCDGTFIHTNHTFDVDTRLQIVLSFPGLLEPVALDSIVRWSRGGAHPGVGVEFLPGPGRGKLEVLIERLRSGDRRAVAPVVRVLVADQNTHVSELICSGLVAAGRRMFGDSLAFAADAVEDGHSALSRLQGASFDVVIIDINLPLIDGTRVIDRARSELGLVALPIIAVSSGGSKARSTALAAGANAYLEKPMRLRDVIASLHELGVTP